MIIKDIGHHTCSKEGGEEVVLQKAPFLSKKGFVGTGYYFWQDNLEFAKVWGKYHYNGDYYILEFELNIYYEELLDLVGNRTQMIKFKEFIDKMKEYLKKQRTNEADHEEIDNWRIGEIIEFLKRKGIFEYKIIKAIDNKANLNYKYSDKKYFQSQDKGYLFFNPRIFYCFVEKKELYFPKREIIYKS